MCASSKTSLNLKAHDSEMCIYVQFEMELRFAMFHFPGDCNSFETLLQMASQPNKLRTREIVIENLSQKFVIT